jgi:hypothetical protein
MADPGGRAVWGEGLWSLVCRDFGFEFRREYGCLSLVNIVLLGRGLCDGPISRPGESCRVCVTQCDKVQQ